ARSACYYVVRVLVDPDVPASGGAFAPVAVKAPAGCLVNARPPAAVAAGNVETSSRIVDVVMRAFGKALDVPAQGQGTMNNVTLGNDRFTYYETSGGDPGSVGRNLLNSEPLPAKVTRDLAAGDVVSIETPGGGGWGS